VSRAWVVPTQEHHFGFLNLDRPRKVEKWCACFAPDPNGVSRYVRRLFLQAVELPYLEGSKEHLLAFTRVECLTVDHCSCVFQLPSMEWFPQMESRLAELQLSGSSATPHNVTSLLSALPRLKNLEIYDLVPMDGDETNLPTISQVLFFQGANCLTLYPNYCGSYPSWFLSWVPSSAWLTQLEMDMECALDQLDFINQWLVSSHPTLNDLTMFWNCSHGNMVYISLSH